MASVERLQTSIRTASASKSSYTLLVSVEFARQPCQKMPPVWNPTFERTCCLVRVWRCVFFLVHGEEAKHREHN